MPYVPDASDASQPTTDKFVESAAAEFRALKVRVNAVTAAPSGTFVKLITEFGALGDNSAGSTAVNNAAITAAIAYMASTGNNVLVPAGIYYCDPFAVEFTSYAGQANFIGVDRERCVFKRANSGVGAFVTVGSASGTIFKSGVGMSNLKIDGGATSNGPAFLGYDIVRSRFESCQFTGGVTACDLRGGISITFASCLFEAATIGVKIDKFTSAAGGGWPNSITFEGGEVVDNTLLGVYVDNARSITFEGTDIEGNGTSPGADVQGGVYTGASMGQEVVVNDSLSVGVTLRSCWLEGNRGIADLKVTSGNTVVDACTFFSSSGQTTYDMYFTGCWYSVKDSNCSFAKTANLQEGTVAAGSMIQGSQISSIVRTSTSTIVIGITGIDTRSGQMPVAIGLNKPCIQTGYVVTSGGNGSITFSPSFSILPAVMLTIADGISGSAVSAKVTNLTVSGATVQSSYIGVGGGSPILSTATVMWVAVGATT